MPALFPYICPPNVAVLSVSCALRVCTTGDPRDTCKYVAYRSLFDIYVKENYICAEETNSYVCKRDLFIFVKENYIYAKETYRDPR